METPQEIGHHWKTAMPGRIWVIASLVCAVLSLAFAPVEFGPLGVVAGAVAVWRSARSRGTLGVSACFVSAVFIVYWAMWLAT